MEEGNGMALIFCRPDVCRLSIEQQNIFLLCSVPQSTKVRKGDTTTD